MITQKLLKKLFYYDPDKGHFIRKVSTARRAKVGDIAGTKNDRGYIHISVNSTHQKAHRLAWTYVYGSTPTGYIDHINGVRDDNRIVNLRECTQAQNCANSAKGKNNTSGIKGVSWSRIPRLWAANIMVNGKAIHLGLFWDKDVAAQSLRIKRAEVHEEFANHGSYSE